MNATSRITGAPRGPSVRAHAAPAGHVERDGEADEEDGSGVERPRCVRSHAAASSQMRTGAVTRAVRPSARCPRCSRSSRPRPAGAAARRCGPGDALCGACRAALPFLRGERCPRCALPVPCGRRCPAAGGVARGRVVPGRVRRARTRPRARAEVPRRPPGRRRHGRPDRRGRARRRRSRPARCWCPCPATRATCERAATTTRGRWRAWWAGAPACRSPAAWRAPGPRSARWAPRAQRAAPTGACGSRCARGHPRGWC